MPADIDINIFFFKSAIFNWSTQLFFSVASYWGLYLISTWITNTSIFLYDHSEASVKFDEFAN